MGRLGHHINTLLNIIFAAAALSLIVLGIVSLAQGRSMRYFSVMAGICGGYYLARCFAVYLKGGKLAWLKGLLLALLAGLCGAFAYLCYRCL